MHSKPSEIFLDRLSCDNYTEVSIGDEREKKRFLADPADRQWLVVTGLSEEEQRYSFHSRGQVAIHRERKCRRQGIDLLPSIAPNASSEPRCASVRPCTPVISSRS